MIPSNQEAQSLPLIEIRPAAAEDRDFILELMDYTLSPYYGGDHRAHARRILMTHLSGGLDSIGYFSFEQRMYLITVDSKRAGMIHLVGKRQGTYKISPIIVVPEYRGLLGLGERLLHFAEDYAREKAARQLYCTVADANNGALEFFLRHGYVVAGSSYSHYRPGVTEVMLYKRFYSQAEYNAFDRLNISVVPCTSEHEPQVRALLLKYLPRNFGGIDDAWVNALFGGYSRRDTRDVNLKYKLIYVAIDRKKRVIGVAGATPKKGEPIKVMPFIATTLPAFVALLSDVPYELQEYGRKLYIHLTPTVDETIALQQRGWRLDAALPGAYRPTKVTQQWSLDLEGENVMRTMRVKQRFLDLIRSGRKTLEVRVGYPALKSITPGDRIRLMSRDETDVIRVIDVRRYSSFAAMIESEDPRQIAPDIRPGEVLPLLRKIYPSDKERLGVLVLEIGMDRERRADNAQKEGPEE